MSQPEKVRQVTRELATPPTHPIWWVAWSMPYKSEKETGRDTVCLLARTWYEAREMAFESIGPCDPSPMQPGDLGP